MKISDDETVKIFARINKARTATLMKLLRKYCQLYKINCTFIKLLLLC